MVITLWIVVAALVYTIVGGLTAKLWLWITSDLAQAHGDEAALAAVLWPIGLLVAIGTIVACGGKVK
jgi:hypothetical protein